MNVEVERLRITFVTPLHMVTPWQVERAARLVINHGRARYRTNGVTRCNSVTIEIYILLYLEKLLLHLLIGRCNRPKQIRLMNYGGKRNA